MPKTVQLTTTSITQIIINVVNENVTILYVLSDDTGAIYQSGELVLWRTLPTPPPNPDGTPGANPDNWVQLPPTAKANFEGVVQYAKMRVTKLLD